MELYQIYLKSYTENIYLRLASRNRLNQAYHYFIDIYGLFLFSFVFSITHIIYSKHFVLTIFQSLYNYSIEDMLIILIQLNNFQKVVYNL